MGSITFPEGNNIHLCPFWKADFLFLLNCLCRFVNAQTNNPQFKKSQANKLTNT